MFGLFTAEGMSRICDLLSSRRDSNGIPEGYHVYTHIFIYIYVLRLLCNDSSGDGLLVQVKAHIVLFLCDPSAHPGSLVTPAGPSLTLDVITRKLLQSTLMLYLNNGSPLQLYSTVQLLL